MVVNTYNSLSDERRTYTLLPMDTPITTLADRLVLARTASKFSQEEVAKEVGIAQPSYSALERGVNKATTKIGSLANLFSVDAYWLETGQGQMDRPRVGEDRLGYPVLPPREQARTPEERRILRIFRAFNDQQRRGLLAVFEKGE